MGEIYETPTELEDFEYRLDDRINKIEELLDRLEGCIYDAQGETIEHISSLKNELNKPFTKGEGITLFFGGIGGNILVSGFIPETKSFFIYVGLGVIILALLIWFYLFHAKNSTKE